MFDDFPETFDDTVTSVTLRCAEHDMGAAGKRQQAGHHRGIDVKERQSAEGRFAGADAVAEEPAGAPCIRHFIAVAAHRDFRQPRGAPGTEERRHVARLNAAHGVERRTGFPRHFRPEVVDLDRRGHRVAQTTLAVQRMARVTLEHAGRCLRGAPHTIGRIDQHEMLQRLDLVKDRRDFLPEIGPGKWRERHEYAGARRFE